MLDIAHRYGMCSTLVFWSFASYTIKNLVVSLKQSFKDELYQQEDKREYRAYQDWDRIDGVSQLVWKVSPKHRLDNFSIEDFGHVVATVRSDVWHGEESIKNFKALGFEIGPRTGNLKNGTECVLVFTTVDRILAELKKYDDEGNLIEVKQEVSDAA